jgi:lipid-A-disaccharide synthase
MLRIGIVAGEASGDYLGAHLIKALKKEHRDLIVEGVGGTLMQSEGCQSLFPMEKLSVMGIVEVLGSYTELRGIREHLITHFKSRPPDVFIGIDAPDFNLGIERRLRLKGIKTVHYVSPSVWAWRKYRIKRIAKSVDLMLTLFPFELDIYKDNGIPVKCVGHPLAKKISRVPDKTSARQRLGLELGQEISVIGIMPGSRKSELLKLWPPFLHAAELCYRHSNNVVFVCGLLNAGAIEHCKNMQKAMSLETIPICYYENFTHDVLEASDVVLLASGTITLEAMLFKLPMVVAYKLNPLTHLLVKLLAHVNYVSLPNLLVGTDLVPERLQNDCKPERLFSDLRMWLNNPDQVSSLAEKFEDIHNTLDNDNESMAAEAILTLIATK